MRGPSAVAGLLVAARMRDRNIAQIRARISVYAIRRETSDVGTTGTGGYIVPAQVQDLYPLYPSPKSKMRLMSKF